MPGQLWVIFDTQAELYCSHYSTNPNFCSWGGPATAQVFSSKQDTDNAIAAWPGGDQNGKFIGKNPPPH
jgi:hypothetical protein